MDGSTGVVDVYDSLPPVVTSTLTSQIAAILSTRSLSPSCVTSGTAPKWGERLWTICRGIAVALCAGKDPHSCNFYQQSMRSHHLKCLGNEKLSMFPAASRPQRHTRSRVRPTRTVRVYCIRRQSWSKTTNIYGDLAKCEGCGEWFHQECAGVPDTICIEKSHSWFCSVVVSSLHTHHTVITQSFSQHHVNSLSGRGVFIR